MALDIEKLDRVVQIYEDFGDNAGVRGALNALKAGTATETNLRDTDVAAKSANMWVGGDSRTIDRAARRAVRAALIVHDAVVAEIGVFGARGEKDTGYEKIAEENMEKLLAGVA
jgi:hypothetical protein